MAENVLMTMDGMLLNWLKNPGDQVNSGDVIAEVEADKATVEVEAPASGVLLEVRASTGEELTEGAVIAVIGAEGESAPAAPKSEAPAEEEAPAEKAEAPAAPAAPAAATTTNGRIKASPLARKVAEEKGIDLSQVQGTGPGGRIVKADVEDYTPPAKKPAAAPTAEQPALVAPQRKPPAEGPDVEYIEIGTMRKRIAAGTVESKQFTPHFYVTSDMDVAALLNLRKELNNNLPEGGSKISVNDMVVKATALTLRQFPNLNTHYYGDKLVRHKRIHIGIAVALAEGGVIYIVSRDADKLALGTMAEENRAMATRARDGKIKPTDIGGATFSTSNLGGFDVNHFAAIINPPEAGVLAFGTAKAVPVVKPDGTLGVGQRMNVTISVDHRVSDGAEGAAFLQAFRELIENPLRLLI